MLIGHHFALYFERLPEKRFSFGFSALLPQRESEPVEERR